MKSRRLLDIIQTQKSESHGPVCLIWGAYSYGKHWMGEADFGSFGEFVNTKPDGLSQAAFIWEQYEEYD